MSVAVSLLSIKDRIIQQAAGEYQLTVRRTGETLWSVYDRVGLVGLVEYRVDRSHRRWEGERLDECMEHTCIPPTNHVHEALRRLAA